MDSGLRSSRNTVAFTNPSLWSMGAKDVVGTFGRHGCSRCMEVSLKRSLALSSTKVPTLNHGFRWRWLNLTPLSTGVRLSSHSTMKSILCSVLWLIVYRQPSKLSLSLIPGFCLSAYFNSAGYCEWCYRASTNDNCFTCE